MALSAPLLTRRRLIQVKIEAAKGTAETATLLDLLAWDVEISPEDPFVQRRYSSGFLGHLTPGVLEYTYAGRCKFKAELRDAGSAAIHAAVAACLTACGLKNTAETYTPTSLVATMKTLTIFVFEDGRKKSIFGAMGDCTITSENGRMVAEFDFQGVWAAPVDAALPTPTMGSAAPIPWGHASNTFTWATNAIRIGNFSMKLGNTVAPRWKDGIILYYLVTERDPTIEIDPESDLVAGYDIYGTWLAGTTAAVAMALTNGTRTFTWTIGKAQIREIKPGDRDGILIDTVTAQMVATNGDDEFTLVVT